jgi:cell division septation protein DedD
MAEDLQNEVLEFDDDALPELPDDNPFEEVKSKKPWLLVGVGIVAITLVVVVVLKLMTGGRDEPGLIEIPIESAGIADIPSTDFVDQANKLVAVDQDKPVGMPERVVENRRDVKFDPDKPSVRRPKPRPIGGRPPRTETDARPRAANVAPKPGTWSVQVGSYPSRSAAESGQRKLQSAHRDLFGGYNFAILAAVLPTGGTTYRLRVVGFRTGGDANSFCRNAQSDGVQCYVTK